MEKMSFAIVGSGWRAMFFARIARRFPELFELKGVLCHRAERASELIAQGVPAFTSEAELIAARPELVVTAVEKGANFAAISRFAGLGFPVLAETPAGCGYEELEKLWRLHEAGARIGVAEQYFRYPLIAAGLRAVERGVLGTPQCVYLSLCHDYHAADVIRRMLMLDRDRFPDFSIAGQVLEYPVECTDSRFGPVTDGALSVSGRVLAQIRFDGGRTAIYDFDGVQYHTFIRARHIDLRGERGQWTDTTLIYSDESHTPRRAELRAEGIPGYDALMTPELAEIGSRWDPYVHMEQAQDEYAISTLMADMAGYIRGGSDAAPLRDALEDAYIWLKLSEALSSPGSTVRSGPRPWQSI